MGPYTLAAEIIEMREKANDDDRRWDTLKISLNNQHNLLDKYSCYQIVDDIFKLTDYFTGADINDENLRSATEGLVEILSKSSQNRVLTRTAMHLATILDTIDKKNIWPDILSISRKALIPGGVLNYVLSGLERHSDYSWEEIIGDSNSFLHSDLMMAYDEGTFWKDVYYLLDFLSDALEQQDRLSVND